MLLINLVCVPAPEAPTIMTNVVESDAVMQQDATGPVLPVLGVEDVDEAVAFIGRREKPLCVYVYSSDDKVSSAAAVCPHPCVTQEHSQVRLPLSINLRDNQVIARLMSETSSGAFCANDSVVQSMMVGLPCGGVGESLPARLINMR